MLIDGVSLLISALLVFASGAACGARMVYRFRHVTTKSLHQSLLNTLELQRLEYSPRFLGEDNDVLVVLEDK